jgi:hypothetical protein
MMWLGLSDVGFGFDAGRRCAIRVPGSIEGPRLDSIDSPLVNLVLKGLQNVEQFFFSQNFTAWKNIS